MVVLLDSVAFQCLWLTMSRCAALDEFRFAVPEVHVVNRLASEALHRRGGLRYAHGLYRLQAWCVA